MTTSGISGYSPYFSSLQMAASGRTPTLARGQNSVCVIDDGLTSQDKSLVTAAEGGVDFISQSILSKALDYVAEPATSNSTASAGQNSPMSTAGVVRQAD